MMVVNNISAIHTCSTNAWAELQAADDLCYFVNDLPPWMLSVPPFNIHFRMMLIEYPGEKIHVVTRYNA